MHTARRSVTTSVVSLLLAVGVAQAADRFVSTAGSDTANDCLTSASPCRTVGHALAQAASGDSVKLAGGRYVENLTVNTATTLTLSGGWAADFSAQDPAAMRTVLQAAMELPVLTVLANGITMTLAVDGLTIQGGHNFPRAPGMPPCQEGLGGGMCAEVSAGGSLSVALSRLILRANLANSAGGGLMARTLDGTSLTLTVTDSTVTQNAAGSGGGVAIVGEISSGSVNATIDHVVFRRNRATGVHGPIITPSEFVLAPAGGGLLSSVALVGPGGNPSAGVLVQNSTFEGNRATPTRDAPGGGSGGGLSALSGGLTVVNSVFTDNIAPFSGGLEAWHATLVNVTATRNVATKEVGGVLLGPEGAVLNSILWGNLGVDLETYSGGICGKCPPPALLDHSDVHVTIGAVDHGGNIDSDPLFVAPSTTPASGRRGHGNIHLRSGSPAIDTGTCTGAPTTDFEGDPRPSGAGCDMGADEFVP